jgi:hypothetical protein
LGQFGTYVPQDWGMLPIWKLMTMVDDANNNATVVLQPWPSDQLRDNVN